MRFKTITYDITVAGVRIPVKNAKAARKLVRSLAAAGHYVLCDRITRTPSTLGSERVFRNGTYAPLDNLRVYPKHSRQAKHVRG